MQFVDVAFGAGRDLSMGKTLPKGEIEMDVWAYKLS